MDINFRLFNCDHTFNLDKVQALITKVTQKLHVKGNVEQKYFGLPRMKDLCKELDEGGKMAGYAVFVVHAHESRLSLNEEKAGIGYAKLYRTLLSITDGRVLIVIGGDDNYKGNEQDQLFLSRWAWRKICSQFTEDDMNGTKSFIFSWDDNHNPIHEEALEFYLDQNKSGRKFVPRPRPKQVETSKPVNDKLKAATEQWKSPTNHTSNQTWQSGTNQGHPLPTSSEQLSINERRKSEKTPAATDPLGVGSGPSAPQQEHQEIPGRPKQTETPKPVNDKPKAATEQWKSSTNHTSNQACKPAINQGCPLPTSSEQPSLNERRKSEKTPAATDPLGSGPSAPQQEPQDIGWSSTVQQGVPGPTVHVIVLHHTSHHEAVMDVFHEIYESLHFTGVPMLGSIDSKYLSEYCRTTKPDYMVFVSEYDEFMDLKNLEKKLDHLRGLFKIINKSAGTELIFVVTANPTYTQGEPSSVIVDQNALYLNNDILQPGKLMVLSWNQRPCDVHREVLKDQLSRPRDSIMDIYRPIDNGQWMSIGGGVPGAVSTQTERTLFKIAEVHINDKKHRSLEAYSYHSSPKSSKVVRKFFQDQLGIQCTSSKTQLKVEDIVEQIRSRQPEFVVFSTDIDVFQNTNNVEEIAKFYLKEFSPLIAGLKGIIVLLPGDKEYVSGCLASSTVQGYVHHFTTLFPMISSKLTVMSWKDKPFIDHLEEMERLLVRPEIQQPAPRTDRPTEEQYVVVNPPPSTGGLVYDPAKGYLRYRAYLVHGHVYEVLYCHPPGWTPDKDDLDLISRKHANEPENVLEFWADSPDGLPKTIDVKRVEKKSTFFSKLPKLPSLPSW